MNMISIVGTGTDVGKTIVSASLYAFLYQQHYNVKVQKWISSGDDSKYSNDLFFSLQFAVLKPNEAPFYGKYNKKIQQMFEKDLKYMNLYSFQYPASPHLVSQKEHKKINKQKILKSIKYFEKQNLDYLIIEGVGGIMTPLTQSLLYVDLLEELKIPSLIVVNNILGAINSSILTVNELQNRHIPILGFVFNDWFENVNLIRKDNKKIIRKITKLSKFTSFGKLKTAKDFYIVGEKIFKNLLKN